VFNERLHDYNDRMAVDMHLLPPAVARAAARAREAIGVLDTTPPDVTPLSPTISAFADWAMESGELAKAIERVAVTDPDLADEQ
jgi:hypothetical protein